MEKYKKAHIIPSIQAAETEQERRKRKIGFIFIGILAGIFILIMLKIIQKAINASIL